MYYIGIDIGATNTRIAVADEGGRILKRIRFSSPHEGDENTVAEVILEKLRSEFAQYLDRVKSVGIGTIGPVDLRRGMVVNTPNLGIPTFHLVKPLSESLKRPVYMLNDCVAAVWGERRFGAARGVDNAVYITISTGIGGGVIVNGALLLGKDGNAHEIGHIVVDYKYRLRCGCGGYGHWEGYASGSGIPRFAKYIAENEELSPEEQRSPLYELALAGGLRSEILYREARRGDAFAKRVVEEVTRINIAGVASVINVYDPEVVTIGGSIALRNPDLVIEPIVREAPRNIITRAPRIEATPLGDDAVLYGAIALAMEPPETLLRMLQRAI